MKKRHLSMASSSSNSQQVSWVYEVIPPRTTSTRDPAALETLMQSLVLDRESSIALEVAGSSQIRRFVVRAGHQQAAARWRAR